MLSRFKVYFYISAFAVGVVSFSTFVNVSSHNDANRIVATDSEYSITLDSTKTPAGLDTSAHVKNFTHTVATGLESNYITIGLTNAKKIDNAYVHLGNHGTVYCITGDIHHISGITSVKATYSSGSLKLKSSSVNTTDGSSYITSEVSVTSGSTYTLDVPADSFVLEAQDANVTVTEIVLTYSCVASSTPYDFTQVHNVEDFESYTETGTGFDANHGVAVSTGLRAAYYSTYYGNGPDPLNGSNWTKMGSTDYLTYVSNKGVNNSKCALMKSNNSNYFNYLQSKSYFGIPTAIGKGNYLSVYMRGAYTSTAATTNSSYSPVVKIYVFYSPLLNTSGSNDGAWEQYTVQAGSDWGKYTLKLDPTKTVYAYGIHISKMSSGTIYLPVDNVTIYTNEETNNWPVGNFLVHTTVASVSNVPILFSFSNVRKAVDVRFQTSQDVGVTSYSYDESTHKFTIGTNGKYKKNNYTSYAYGNITGTYDAANNQLTGVGCAGAIKSYVTNNNSLTCTRPTKYWDCDGTTAELKTVFKRRYGGTLDTTNYDSVSAASYNPNSGISSLRVRLSASYLSQLNLLNDMSATTLANIGFWVYSSFSSDQTVRIWVYKAANLGSNVEIGSVTAKAGQWTFCSMGFTSASIYNFQLGFENYDPNNGQILVDDICLY